jgi:signal transduction histidine kinase
VSLRLRLGLWYGALTGLVVIAVTLLTYVLHTRGHYDDADHVLVGVTQHIAEELNSQLVAGESTLGSPTAGVVLRVYDPTGAVIEASADAGLAPIVSPDAVLGHSGPPAYDPLVGLAPTLTQTDVGSGSLGLATDGAGSRWRVYAVRLQDGRSLVAELPLDSIDASVDRLRQLVPILAVLGAGTTLVAGFLLAGRALRPVSMLTDSAAAIEHSRDFERRVPEPPRQDELGRLARTFNRMLGSLEQAYRAQKQFVGDASHELRAPLTAIQGNLELLERHPEMNVCERREALREANREARRLTQLVADLLALARADAGVPIRHERVELDRVVLDVLGESRHLVQGQLLSLDAIEPVQVVGDPDRLKQLTLILVDNAIKYTPESGSVSVSLRRNDHAAMLEVHDTGIGIAQSDLPRVFERFYRADPARRRDVGGTGLGLSIARWIAEQHGADICLSSEPGRGTRVLVRFPLLA